MSSRTKVVHLDKLDRDPEFASVLLRLMMVVNDFAMANDTLSMWRKNRSRHLKSKREEAFKYLVELQIAHVYEGMGIVREINAKPRLKAFVGQCDRPTRAEFDQLVAYRATPMFEGIMGRVRNNLAFHYDPKLVEGALSTLVRRHPGTVGSITVGTDSSDWLFEPGALINERVAVREVFKVPEDASIKDTTDAILLELQTISMAFSRFAGYFVWKHTS